MHYNKRWKTIFLTKYMVLSLLSMGLSAQLFGMNVGLSNTEKGKRRRATDKLIHDNQVKAVKVDQKITHDLAVKKGKLDGAAKVARMFDAVEKRSFLDLVSLPHFKQEEMYMRNEKGQTLLHRAAETGQYCMADLFILRGAPIDAIEETNIAIDALEHSGATALHLAAGRGYEELVGLLLYKGASSLLLDKRGYTALHWAAKNGHEKVVDLLLIRGAEIDVGTREGDTALHLASLHGHKEVVGLLLKRGAGIFVNLCGLTPYRSAANNGHIEIAVMLLK